MVNPKDIFEISSDKDFEDLALQVFQYQHKYNTVYRSFCDLLYKNPSDVKSIEEIPFLPIQFFKSYEVICKNFQPEITFTSSGTTGQQTSKHLVLDKNVYEQSFLSAFKQFYGNVEEYVVLALLPSYIEREGSSLIYMVERLISLSNQIESGFYLHNIDELIETLTLLNTKNKKILLIGVSFALLDLVEQHSFSLNNTIVMETGGMKGRRKEITREELHSKLKKGFGVKNIHSEYGMTELLSQAYSYENGLFKCPNWMRVLTRDTEDALSLLNTNKTGGINVIDLANIHSCAFIATQDLGKVYEDKTFEVLGRFDNSDIRGCNLMAL